MHTYPADTAETRINRYGADTLLTRTFEYCDKAAAAGDIDVAPIECFAAILLGSGAARIESEVLVVDEPEVFPMAVWASKVRVLLDMFSEWNDRGKLDPWIIAELRHLREFQQTVHAGVNL